MPKIVAEQTDNDLFQVLDSANPRGFEDAQVSAPRSPWQNAFVERLVGSIRRECLDHVVILSERHLRRVLRSYFFYYHGSRTHLALAKDAPEPRAIQYCGEIVAIPRVGGLHHHYERRIT